MAFPSLPSPQGSPRGEDGGLLAAVRNGRHAYDLRVGWCVAHDEVVALGTDADPAGRCGGDGFDGDGGAALARVALRAVALASGAGRQPVSAAVACAGLGLDPSEVADALQKVWASARPGRALLLRLPGGHGSPLEALWARWAQAGRVERPLDDDRAEAVGRAVGGRPPAATRVPGDAAGWWLLGGWLRTTAAAVRSGEQPWQSLSVRAPALLARARTSGLLM